MHSHAKHEIDPTLERALRRIVAWGAIAVVLLPAARAHYDWIGWMPLWLLGMPLSAWWALHRFSLPRRARPQAVPMHRRRRGVVQTRRYASIAVDRQLRVA